MRRALGATVALILLLTLVGTASARERRGEGRVPSAQLQATGSGSMLVAGRLSVNGSIPGRGALRVVDHAGDATAYLAGEKLDFDDEGRVRVRRASGILFVTGSRVSVQVIGADLSFSIAGYGRARLLGTGVYTLNSDPEEDWSRGWIRLAPSRSDDGDERQRAAAS